MCVLQRHGIGNTCLRRKMCNRNGTRVAGTCLARAIGVIMLGRVGYSDTLGGDTQPLAAGGNDDRRGPMYAKELYAGPGFGDTHTWTGYCWMVDPTNGVQSYFDGALIQGNLIVDRPDQVSQPKKL